MKEKSALGRSGTRCIPFLHPASRARLGQPRTRRVRPLRNSRNTLKRLSSAIAPRHLLLHMSVISPTSEGPPGPLHRALGALVGSTRFCSLASGIGECLALIISLIGKCVISLCGSWGRWVVGGRDVACATVASRVRMSVVLLLIWWVGDIAHACILGVELAGCVWCVVRRASCVGSSLS